MLIAERSNESVTTSQNLLRHSRGEPQIALMRHPVPESNNELSQVLRIPVGDDRVLQRLVHQPAEAILRGCSIAELVAQEKLNRKESCVDTRGKIVVVSSSGSDCFLDRSRRSATRDGVHCERTNSLAA